MSAMNCQLSRLWCPDYLLVRTANLHIRPTPPSPYQLMKTGTLGHCHFQPPFRCIKQLNELRPTLSVDQTASKLYCGLTGEEWEFEWPRLAIIRNKEDYGLGEGGD